MTNVEKYFVHVEYTDSNYSGVSHEWWDTREKASEVAERFQDRADVVRVWVERDDFQENHR